MTGFAAFTSLLPLMQREWSLSNSEAGLIGGVFYAGYMAAVPVLTSLTDRIDSRRIYAWACVLSLVGAAGFALFAQGLWTALLFQFLIGAGLAGTYMPGSRRSRISSKAACSRAARRSTPRALASAPRSRSSCAARSARNSAGRWAFVYGALGPFFAAATGQARDAPRPHSSSARAGAAAPRFPAGVQAALHRRVYRRLLRSQLRALRSALVDGRVPRVLRIASACGCADADRGCHARGMHQHARPRDERRRQRTRTALRTRARDLHVHDRLGARRLRARLYGRPPWWIVVVLMAFHYGLMLGDSAALTAGAIASAPPDQRGSRWRCIRSSGSPRRFSRRSSSA